MCPLYMNVRQAGMLDLFRYMKVGRGRSLAVLFAGGVRYVSQWSALRHDCTQSNWSRYGNWLRVRSRALLYLAIKAIGFLVSVCVKVDELRRQYKSS